MKDKKAIRIRIANNRHEKELRRKNKYYKDKISRLRDFNGKTQNIAEMKHNLLSEDLKYIFNCKKANILQPSSSYFNVLKEAVTIEVPEPFSLVDNADKSYKFISDIINCLYHNRVRKLNIDYKNCKTIHLGAQIYLDILLRDMFKYSRQLHSKYPNFSHLESVKPININNKNVRKLLYSIGSYAILKNEKVKYDDIIPYNLCEFKANPSPSAKMVNIETKERHVTEMVEYVIESLGRMDKILTSESIENLSIIIGEVLINAEEHSTNNHRFSIGYFQDYSSNSEEYGIFNLVILNFGETIYDKFKDEDCARPDIVRQMKALSNDYTSKNLFGTQMKEETLWTLYALQEEVTSVSPKKNIKRGNGSIKFIESFFNLKGNNENQDKVSRLALLSGNTSIVFDGTYGIKESEKGDEKFKVMTFNKSAAISDRPDTKYVKFVKNHFPGTIISAQILISKDDLL
ncbi:hypothetical protein C7447_103149 [Tenacibaculum adriaticum]|uniref:Uncharacterized protein n=1 Tax=Tenacibaculum adriaticum TaxID=413713 RepID=A0A5S5DSY8_9FLAO|nr:hypothetical protein [Tenacibaculum adriaticum]TYP97982.1 hypothetical protein C7447_103149 [Tenacibaculum adriaticum]